MEKLCTEATFFETKNEFIKLEEYNNCTPRSSKTLNSAINDADSITRKLEDFDKILAAVDSPIKVYEENAIQLAIQQRNREELCRTMESLIETLECVTEEHICTLNYANFSNTESVQKCKEAVRAVTKFWNSISSTDKLRQMSCYQDAEKRLIVVDAFVDRLLSHLSAMFENLNDLSQDQEWHDLCIPKQSQRFRALLPLSELIEFLKLNRPQAFDLLLRRYQDATSQLYRRLLKNFFQNVNEKVRRNGDYETEIDKQTVPQLIETVFAELHAIVCAEQKFINRFFHIDSSVVTEEYVYENEKCFEKVLNKKIRFVMDGLFISLTSLIRRFCEAICEQDKDNIFFLLVRIAKKGILPAKMHPLYSVQHMRQTNYDPSSYFSNIFELFLDPIEEKFHRYIKQECEELSIIKPNKSRISPAIERFYDIATMAEAIFVKAECRQHLDDSYSTLCTAVFEGIQNTAMDKNLKGPVSVAKFENYHEFYLKLSELKISSLDGKRKEAKMMKEESIDEFVKEYMGRPMEKISKFFDNMEFVMENKGIEPEHISNHARFSANELKSVVSQYSGKEVKKGLEQLYEKVEKYLGTHSSLLQVVWREMQEQFIEQVINYNQLITKCYTGSNIELGVSKRDVLRFFSEIAQQH